MTFLDEAIVEFRSGRGGSGAVAFHTEKFVPKGGPNGSDGGRGGDVVLIADRSRRTLYDVNLQGKFNATDGEHGKGNKRGPNGRGIEVKVPVGTIVSDTETGEHLVDLRIHGMKFVIAKGGKGGRGNMHYVNSVRQAPNFAQKGAPSERVIAKLELKLLADVGLVGLPNAGKSTLISRISAAKPKIADYPFTTIVPNLGVVSFHDETFVVADMPGLILGASQGVGLGTQFLKHIERNRVLVHVVDSFPIDESDPISNYETIENELKSFSEKVWGLPRLVALNKIDLLSPDDLKALVTKFESFGHPIFPISGVTGDGLQPLVSAMAEAVRNAPVEPEIPVLLPTGERANDEWDVKREGDEFRITGKRIEQMVAMTNLDNREALYHLHRRLQRAGVIDKLRTAGVEEGDTVNVGEYVFEFEDPE
jgi:GTP-binding protein